VRSRLRTVELTLLLAIALGFPLLIPFGPAGAFTVVTAQDIQVNTTWTAAGSPYYIQGEVTVNASATLTLEPGVQVLFDGYHALRILGNLSAQGTDVAPLLFQSNLTTPFPGSWKAVEIVDAGAANITHAVFRHAHQGVFVSTSGTVTLSNLTVEQCLTGIWVELSQGVTLLGATISMNRVGILLYDTHLSQFDDVRVSGNDNGIQLQQSDDNVITGGSIFSNVFIGVNMTNSFGNLIHNNTIFDNGVQATDNTDANFWDDGYPAGGNLWGDYNGSDNFSGPNQDQPGADGLGDTPYVIDADSQDGYPRMVPGPNLPPVITLASPENGSMIPLGASIIVRVADVDLNTSSYVLDGAAPVAFANVLVLVSTNWTEGSHTLDVTATDTQGAQRNASWEFFVDATFPVITFVSPPNNALIRPGGVLLDIDVEDQFFDEANWTLDGLSMGPLLAPFEISTATWADGEHTVVVRAWDIAGNVAAGTHTIRSDGTPPRILNVDPADTSTNVSVNVTVVIRFSEAMDRNSVVDQIQFPVTFDLLWSENDTRVEVVPRAPLEHDQLILLKLDGDATDVAGNPIDADLLVAFRTLPDTPTEPTDDEFPWLNIGVVVVFFVAVAIYVVFRQRRERRRREDESVDSSKPQEDSEAPEKD
jgi:parallel beta-helix repeat protein